MRRVPRWNNRDKRRYRRAMHAGRFGVATVILRKHLTGRQIEAARIRAEAWSHFWVTPAPAQETER